MKPLSFQAVEYLEFHANRVAHVRDTVVRVLRRPGKAYPRLDWLGNSMVVYGKTSTTRYREWGYADGVLRLENGTRVDENSFPGHWVEDTLENLSVIGECTNPLDETGGFWGFEFQGTMFTPSPGPYVRGL